MRQNSIIRYLLEKVEEQGRLCTDSNIMIELRKLTDADIRALPDYMKPASSYMSNHLKHLLRKSEVE